MIDIENALFDDLYKTLKAADENVDITDEYEPESPSFPVVTVYIRSEGEPYKMIDSSRRMRGVNIFVEVSAYASRATGFKTKSKELIAIVCDRMKELGFALSMCDPIPNRKSDQIYRYTARFVGIADDKNTIYRR